MTSIGLVLPVRRQGSEQQELGLRRFAATVVAHWRRAVLLRQTRRYVMQMDDRTLADLGISRAQALFEIDRQH